MLVVLVSIFVDARGCTVQFWAVSGGCSVFSLFVRNILIVYIGDKLFALPNGIDLPVQLQYIDYVSEML